MRGEVPIFDPGTYPPIIEPLFGYVPERAEFAYTPKQRSWYLRVYEGKCAFPRYDEQRGWFACKSQNRIEIHHLTPSSWIKNQMKDIDPNSLDLEGGIMGMALCRPHHDDVIHPDISAALMAYHTDNTLIKQVIENHKLLSQEGHVFWNDVWDELMKDIAKSVINNYIIQNPLDSYPQDVAWNKKPHFKHHWSDGLFQ